MTQEIVDDQQKRMPSLPFEIVAEPQYDDLQLVNNTGNSLTEPINIKIKLRNKEEKGNKRGVISVPKLTAHGSGKKVRLVNSDQTIMSFDFFSEADTSKTQHKKSNKNIFRIFNPGRCLRMRNDNDEDYAYLPSTLINSNKIRSTSSIVDGQNNIIGEKLALKKNLTSISPTNTSARIFIGKCKPGGCLDPPFGEDKYSYEPTMKRSSTSFNYVNVSNFNVEKEPLRTNAKSHIFNIENDDSKAKVKNKSEIVITNANEEDYSQSLITYPSISSSKDHMRKESHDIKLKSRISSEDKARISANEFSDIYFIPTKKERISVTEKDKNEKVIKAPDEIIINKGKNYSDQNQTESSTSIVENQFLKSTLRNISSINNDINEATSNTIDETNKYVIQHDHSSKPTELRLTAAAPTVNTDNINNDNENFNETLLKGKNKIQDLEVTNSIKSEQNEDIYFDKRIFDANKNKEIQYKKTKSPSIAVIEASDSKGSLKTQYTLISDANQIKFIHNVESNLDNNLAPTTSKESQQFLKKSKESIQNEVNKIPDGNEIQKLFVKSKEIEILIPKEMDQSLNTSLEFSNKFDDESKLLRNEMDISFKESPSFIEGAAYTDNMKQLSISGNEIKEDEHKSSPNSVSYFRDAKEQIYSSKEYKEPKLEDKVNSHEYKQPPLSKAEMNNIDVKKSISSTYVPVKKLQNSSIESQESIKTPTKVISDKEHADDLSIINKERRKISSLENKSKEQSNAYDLTQLSLSSAKLNNADTNQSVASVNVSAMQLEHPLIKSQESLIISEIISLKDQGGQSSLDLTGHKESFENKIKEKANAGESKLLSKAEINKTNVNQSVDSGLIPVKTLEYSSIKSQETLETDYVDLSSVTSEERKSIIANQATKKSKDNSIDINYITGTSSLNKLEVKTAQVDFVSQNAETKISSKAPETIEDLNVTSSSKESLVEGEKLKYRLSSSEQIEIKAETNMESKTKEANMLSDITANKKFKKINDSKELTIDTIPKTFLYQSSDTNLRHTKKPRTSEVVKTHEEIKYLEIHNIGATDNLNLQDSKYIPKQSHILLEQLSEEVPREPTYSSIIIDFGFISSVDNDNNLVIQTFDPSSPVNEDMSEKISVIQSIIRVNEDEIRIPINFETDLTLQLKKPVSCKGGRSLSQNKLQEDVVEQKRDKTVKLDSLLQETLNSVYENLLPIKTIIKNLQEEAYTLSCQQNSLKEIMNAMETKPMRLTQTNPKCGCIMNKY